MTAGAFAAAHDGPGGDASPSIGEGIARACRRYGGDAEAAIQSWLDESEHRSLRCSRVRGEWWIGLFDGSGKVASGYAQTRTHAEILCARDLWLSRRGAL